jgi:NADH-quinone oxidoreductase subunit G
VVLKTNNVDHHRTADYAAFAGALRGKPGLTASMREVFNAPAVLLIGNDPTNQHPLLAYQIRNNVRLHRSRLYTINSAPIKLRRQSAAFGLLPAGAEAKAVGFLAGDDSLLDSLVTDMTNSDAWIGLREKVRGEQNLVIAFGAELRGAEIQKLTAFASTLMGAKLICLSDYSNSRGAADFGLFPDLLPGYQTVSDPAQFGEEWGAIPTQKGVSLPEMMDAAAAGKLKALYVIGSNPVGRLGIDPAALSKTFVVVQEMFLTETAALADVVLPAANAYEKEGTITNTCGDVQLAKKAGDVTGTKPDFEMIVRIADAMGFDVRSLVPFGRGTRADMGQTRGPQSGEADRHAVWLEAHNLEPRMTPFDPIAILDEIQRLVPAYDISRINLLAGNDQHTEIAAGGPSTLHSPELVVPANNDLFSSGTLGLYSNTLNSVMENKSADTEVAAD